MNLCLIHTMTRLRLRIAQSYTLLPYLRSLTQPPLSRLRGGLVVQALRVFPQFGRLASVCRSAPPYRRDTPMQPRSLGPVFRLPPCRHQHTQRGDRALSPGLEVRWRTAIKCASDTRQFRINVAPMLGSYRHQHLKLQRLRSSTGLYGNSSFGPNSRGKVLRHHVTLTKAQLLTVLFPNQSWLGPIRGPKVVRYAA